jgi:hypothetical protein
MDNAVTVELTSEEIKRLIDALHTTFDAERIGDKDTSDADKLLLMKLVQAVK